MFANFDVVFMLFAGRFIAPVIGELSEKYPHVTTFKIDIDQVCVVVHCLNFD